ncbi:hypothetical protein CPB84DRAFT_1842107 [Gymnopilus junonius]|uniref:UDP-Glycosyltransferase/glycogen phosphorylase n=1 Tax=Gymnopilus junonius TaxID=109634 RepID=A0A9P5P1M0_GYMJU|nr:hypothetical protein CPB84DRAFT_1842107 [Gymnopilus junonius]
MEARLRCLQDHRSYGAPQKLKVRWSAVPQLTPLDIDTMKWTTSFALSSLFILLSTFDGVLALPMPPPGNQCMINYCPSYFAHFPPRGPRTKPTLSMPTRTNAQRLAGGLGPNPPIHRGLIGTPRQRWATSPSPSPVVPLNPKVTHCGVVRLTDSKTDSQIGYIGKISSSKGHLFVNESISEAVTVCFKLDKDSSTASSISIVLEDWNLKSDFPLFALIQGRVDKSSDIGLHSSNYLTLGGVEWPGSRPQSPPKLIVNSYSSYWDGFDRTAESSVWNINLTTGKLTVQWTNSDRSQPTTQLFTVGNVLYAGGDLDAFVTHHSRGAIPLQPSVPQMSFKHILFSVFPAWGHTRPFCILAARLVKEHADIIVTMIIGPSYLSLAQSEISAEFGDRVPDEIRRRVRFLSTIPPIQSGDFIGSMRALVETYATAYQALSQAKTISCAVEGTIFDAIPPPVVVILDFIALPQLQATRAISGRSVPIIAWVTGHMSSTTRWFLPESAGGIGDLGARIDAEVARTGSSPEEIGEKLYKQAVGRVVKVIGLPDMYDYEFFPQKLPFSVPISIFMKECDAEIVATSHAFENELLNTLQSGLPDWKKETYVVGPLLPSGYGITGQSVTGSDEIQAFLDEKFEKHGQNSVLLISFGSAFWTSAPEYLEEIVEVLIEKKFPFICSFASPIAKISPEMVQKVKSSSLGILQQWVPQQFILNHPATGWLLTHCGQSSVTEALAAGVPMIAWPFDADQPAAAARLAEELHVAFELVEVRTGETGMRPLLRNGRTAKGTREAVGLEFRKVIDDCRSEKGFEMRRNAENIKVKLLEAWKENGKSRQELSAFLDKYVYA